MEALASGAGKARRGKARQSETSQKQGEAKRGEARQSKPKQSRGRHARQHVHYLQSGKLLAVEANPRLVARLLQALCHGRRHGPRAGGNERALQRLDRRRWERGTLPHGQIGDDLEKAVLTLCEE